MSEEELTIEQYQAKIAELEAQLEQSGDNNLDEIKNKYETIIEEKNTEIHNLKNEVNETKQKVNDTVDTLKDEVQAKLDANEEYQKLLATVEELEKEKAETTVDTYIQKGVLLPSQRETAIKLCLNDNDTFLELYKDAKPIVEIQNNRKSISNGTADQIVNYFKK